MSRGLAAVVLALGLVAAAAAPASAYLQLTVNVRGRVTPVTWASGRVRWFSTTAAAPGVTATQFQNALDAAFDTWEAVPTATIAFTFGGFTQATPSDDNDGLSVMGFEEHSDLDRTLAATGFTIDTVTGAIVESDVFFNTAFPWSAAGAGNAFDLQSVATHEIGHFLGLGHSALGETEVQADGGRRVIAAGAVMFPIAFGRGITLARTLQPDDLAGVSVTYPERDFAGNTGSVQGRVRLGSRGLLGSHVAAFSLETGALVGGFALNDAGEFLIEGLPPGLYVIRAEPLDDASTDSFFDEPGIDTNFRVTFHDRVVPVPTGGAGPSFDLTVTSK